MLLSVTSCDIVAGLGELFGQSGSTELPGENAGGNGGNGITDSPNGGNDGSGGAGGNTTGEPVDYFGKEHSYITVEKALELAKSYTNKESSATYCLIVRVDDIGTAALGEMTVFDDTGSIYVYESRMEDGTNIKDAEVAVGDVLVIYGTLRNYKGTLEIQTGKVYDFITPDENTVLSPNLDGDPENDVDNGNTDSGNTGGNGGTGSTGGNGGNGGTGTDIPAVEGGTVIYPAAPDPITSDPYVNVDVSEFYQNYTPAVSYMDSYYRSLHNLMSGTIADQDQEPTISVNRPIDPESGRYLRNTTYLFSADGNTYYVVDADGDIAMEIYRGGAYIMLEEVAAYVFAFGEPPVNHSYSKKTKPTSSVWGEYLRVNHTQFSGSTAKYPYEPMLPNISGCGGDLVYYEMDIGTTGTDCDPSYEITVYNDGTTITRGAARIVYTRQDLDGDGVIELGETFLFYTYNHYNDFQEYLNYEGGWGEMFGNITGGGTLSSKTDYNPTDYVSVVGVPFVTADSFGISVTVVAMLPSKFI